MSERRVELGLRENRAQFGLLVAINAFVGAMVGLERSTLPLIGEVDFGLASKAAVLSFIVAFGLAKALTNLGAGALAQRLGRRRLLIAGWAIALPVPLLAPGAAGEHMALALVDDLHQLVLIRQLELLVLRQLGQQLLQRGVTELLGRRRLVEGQTGEFGDVQRRVQGEAGIIVPPRDASASSVWHRVSWPGACS